MEPTSKAVDVFGIKPVGDAIHTVTKGVMDGASAFLSRICLPAAEELGFLLRDRVSAWRNEHAVLITKRAEQMVRALPEAEKRHAHPRVVAQVIELGSWSEADEVREMWAGLLASGCTFDGRDDSNLMFIDLLACLSASQARLLDYVCKNSVKRVVSAGWIVAADFQLSLAQIQTVCGISDFHRIDRELDHLRALGLLTIDAGFPHESTDAGVTPSPLALQMYARCHGNSGDLLEFYGLKPSGCSTKEAPETGSAGVA